MIQIENYLLLFFFILAAILGAFFYTKRQRLQTIWVRYILGALRFLSIFSLLLLLLSPILECNKTKSIRPKLVLLVDNSRSIKFSDKENFKSEVEKLVDKLADLNLYIDVKAFDDDSQAEELEFKTGILQEYVISQAKQKILNQATMRYNQLFSSTCTASSASGFTQTATMSASSCTSFAPKTPLSRALCTLRATPC